MTQVALEIFNQAADYWQSRQAVELPALAVEHIEATLVYAREHPEEVNERARQLDAAIARFNQQRVRGGFATDEVNCKKLATKILADDETLPQLAELPDDSLSREAFFEAFLNMTKHHYYTFLDKPEIEYPKILITGLLVDGYGFALRAKRAIEYKHTVGKDDITIVYAICEMVGPGPLQTEMYLANWYKFGYGLSQEFCERISQQFGVLKPLK